MYKTGSLRSTLCINNVVNACAYGDISQVYTAQMVRHKINTSYTAYVFACTCKNHTTPDKSIVY